VHAVQGKYTTAEYEQEGNAAYSRAQRYSALVGAVRVAPSTEYPALEVYVQVHPHIQPHTTTTSLLWQGVRSDDRHRF